jgi:hypothetical protein
LGGFFKFDDEWLVWRVLTAISSFQNLWPIEEVNVIIIRPFDFNNKCANILTLYDLNIGEIEDLGSLSQVSDSPLNSKIGQIFQLSSNRIEKGIYSYLERKKL